MSEQVIVRMNNQFETGFWATDPNQPDEENFQPIDRVYEITPYGMLLASIASCTAQVVLTYAHHHDLPLEEVELRGIYRRSFKHNCEHCEEIDRYEEHILEQIAFHGDLDLDQRKKLFKIAHQCPIARMFETGIEIKTEMLEPSESFVEKTS